MKKTIFALMMLASFVAAQAQGLTGKLWAAQIDEKSGDELIALSFNADNTMNMHLEGVETEKSDEMDLILTIDVDVPGTYTLKGDKLTINLDQDKATVDFDLDIDGADDATKSFVLGMLKSEIDKEKGKLAKEMFKDIPFNNVPFTVKKVTATTLVIADVDDEYEFVAIPQDQ